MTQYTTIQGDTWDMIAKKIYNDEALTGILMGANFDLLDTLVFSSGVVLNIPEKPAAVNNDLPPWRR